LTIHKVFGYLGANIPCLGAGWYTLAPKHPSIILDEWSSHLTDCRYFAYFRLLLLLFPAISGISRISCFTSLLIRPTKLFCYGHITNNWKDQSK